MTDELWHEQRKALCLERQKMVAEYLVEVRNATLTPDVLSLVGRIWIDSGDFRFYFDGGSKYHDVLVCDLTPAYVEKHGITHEEYCSIIEDIDLQLFLDDLWLDKWHMVEWFSFCEAQIRWHCAKRLAKLRQANKPNTDATREEQIEYLRLYLAQKMSLPKMNSAMAKMATVPSFVESPVIENEEDLCEESDDSCW